MRLLFDIETDGLLRQMSVIHCLVVMDIDTEEVYRYDDSGQHPSITEGLTFLMEANELWGHNL